MKSNLFLVVVGLLSILQSDRSFGQERFTKDELEEYEKTEFANLIGRVGFCDSQLCDSLSVSESQKAVFKSYQQLFRKKEVELLKKKSELIAEYQQGAVSQQEYKEAKEHLSNTLTAYRAKVRSRIEEDLLPFQVQKLRSLANIARLVRESDFNDVFGIALVIVKAGESSEEEIRKVELAVREARDDYYNQLRMERIKSNKKVLQSVSAKFRREFVEKYPKFYDFKSESVRSVEFRD